MSREIELPKRPTYDGWEESQLDVRLSQALKAAERVNHEFLSQLLRCELASYRYEHMRKNDE